MVLAGCMLDDPLFTSSVDLKKSWDVGPSPEVIVDLRGGPIYVIPSRDGRVAASVSIGTVRKTSQEDADRAVRDAPGVRMIQEGDRISVIELPGNHANCSLHLSVPEATRLDLHAGAGDICVGSNPIGGSPAPVTLASLKARQDSVGVLVARVIKPSSGPLLLDLEGTNLKLTVNGLPVDVGRPIRDDGPGNGQRWHFISK
jgi:hypothetical protein